MCQVSAVMETTTGLAMATPEIVTESTTVTRAITQLQQALVTHKPQQVSYRLQLLHLLRHQQRRLFPRQHHRLSPNQALFSTTQTGQTEWMDGHNLMGGIASMVC